MIRKIQTIGNPILRKKAVAVKFSEETKQLTRLFKDMAETMLANDGIGLAAPQIGISKRIIAVNTKDGVIVLTNPVLSKKSWKKEIDEEGCLSIPGVFGLVSRHHSVIVTALDTAGVKICFPAKGLFARVLQHETDHLDGILFIDKMKKPKKNDAK